MENGFRYSSEKLLNKLDVDRDSLSPEKLEQLLSRITAPLGPTISESSNRFSVESDKYKITYEYGKLNKGDVDEIEEYIPHTSGYRNDRENRDTYANPQNWKRVQRLRAKIGQIEVDLLNAGPNPYEVFVFEDSADPTGAVNTETGNIYMVGRLDSLGQILALLHEVGHLWDHANLKTMGQESLTDKHMHSDKAEILRKERTASAFALKYASKYLQDPQELRDSIDYLKYYALLTYYKDIHQAIRGDESVKTHIAADWSDWDRDAYEELESDLINDFLEWKNTPEYNKWAKEKREGEPDQSDEFWAWVGWISETEYDYWDDINRLKKLQK